jgi:hypothetical protein
MSNQSKFIAIGIVIAFGIGNGTKPERRKTHAYLSNNADTV